MEHLALLASGLLSGLASILLRHAAVMLPGKDTTALSFDQPVVLRALAVVCYGVGFLAYAYSLNRLTITLAYPIMISVTVVTVVLFAVLTGETLGLRQGLGIALLTVGIWLLVIE